MPYAGNGKDLQKPCLDNRLSAKSLQQLPIFDSYHINKFIWKNHVNITCKVCNTYTNYEIPEVLFL